MKRNVEVGDLGGVDAEELGRRDANDGEGNVVNENRLAGGGGWTTQAALAVSETDDRNGRSARAIVLGSNEAACSGGDFEAAEVVAGDVFAACEIGLAFDGQVEQSGLIVDEEAREDGVVLAEELECGIRKDAAGVAGFGVVIGAAWRNWRSLSSRRPIRSEELCHRATSRGLGRAS